MFNVHVQRRTFNVEFRTGLHRQDWLKASVHHLSETSANAHHPKGWAVRQYSPTRKRPTFQRRLIFHALSYEVVRELIKRAVWDGSTPLYFGS